MCTSDYSSGNDSRTDESPCDTPCTRSDYVRVVLNTRTRRWSRNGFLYATNSRRRRFFPNAPERDHIRSSACVRSIAITLSRAATSSHTAGYYNIVFRHARFIAIISVCRKKEVENNVRPRPRSEFEQDSLAKKITFLFSVVVCFRKNILKLPFHFRPKILRFCFFLLTFS